MTTTPTMHVVEGPSLARVAGLPMAVIKPLAQARLAQLLDDIAAAHKELGQLATTVGELLYQAVPLMDSTAARRKVLAWRRAAHAARPTEVDAKVLAEVRTQLAGVDTTPLEYWTRHAATLTELRARLRKDTVEAGSQEAQTLRELLRTSPLANALAIVSPVFSRSVRQPGKSRLSRGERLTAYRYAVRAAAKTSPLSSLTELAPLRAKDRGQVRISVHPLITRTLLHHAAPRAGIREQMRWRVNDSLRSDRYGTWLSEPQLHVTNGFGWSTDETFDARERSDLTAAAFKLAELPPQRLARHLESGLVSMDDPCSQDELLHWLADRLASSPDPCARRAGEYLAPVADALASIAKSDADHRAQTLTEVENYLLHALRVLGAEDGWPLNAVTTIYEDRATTLDVPPLAPGARAALRQYAVDACHALKVSQAYQAMVAQFVSQFGHGGVCHDVFAFCRSLPHTGWPHTIEPVPQTEPAHPGRSSCRPCVAVLCQQTGRGHEPTVVVNRVSSGGGGLLARFHRLFDGTDGLADHLRDWLRAIYPGVELLEFIPSRTANPLQGDSSGILPALHWPTAPRQSGPGVTVDELHLVHEPARNALELQRRDGSPVAPVYLGTVPQHLIGGAERALLTLSDPWSIPSGLADETASSLREPSIGNSGSAPRRYRAGVVVGRARWWMDADCIPRRRTDEAPEDLLQRIDQWRRQHGLPAEVYVQAEPDALLAHDQVRKPLWLAFASPTGLEALTHMAAHARGRRLIFTECLPARHGASTGDKRATEYTVHFAQPAPEHEGA